MKIRLGFVTNSSSSSFIISKENLTDEQIEAIVKHAESKEFKREGCHPSDAWSIRECDAYIYASTFMDNFGLFKYIMDLGVREEDIDW